MITAAIFTVVFMLIVAIFGMALAQVGLPGHLMKEKAEINSLDSMGDSLRDLDYTSSLSNKGGVDEVEELAGSLKDALIHKVGLSAMVASALVHFPERLEFDTAAWARVKATHDKLIKQGYDEDILAYHYCLVVGLPTAASTARLLEMFKAKVDSEVIQEVLTLGDFSVAKLEEMIRLNNVEAYNWEEAFELAYS